MSTSEVPRAPRIFLSYASEDVNWVSQFKRWFVPPLGNVVLEDFKDGSNLEFGPLGAWLDATVDEAAVMVAFVSSNYPEKVWTRVEWDRGLTKTQRGQLIFVPIMMDADAKLWWAKLRKQRELSVLPVDYQYSDFAVEGRPAVISDSGPIVDQISKLAQKIRIMLEEPSPEQPSPLSVPDIILLGHPFGRFDVSLEAQVDEADQLLRKHSVRSKRGEDGWRNTDVKLFLHPSSNPSILVQPLAPGEAEQPLAYAAKTAQLLAAIGGGQARVAIWVPNAQKDAIFSEAANSASPNSFPALRTDTPRGLVSWLYDLIRPTTPDAVVLQIETIGYPENSTPDAGTTRLAEDLQQRFSGIVNREILPPPGLWPFWGEEFNEQVKMLTGNRVIVAVHDLDITPSADDGTIRTSLEMKLNLAQNAVEQANKVSEGSRRVDPFFTALLVKNAKALPFASYPLNGRFKDWRLLRFEPSSMKPMPASLAVFRGQLNMWAAQRRRLGAAA
jgi:hypothetical protein